MCHITIRISFLFPERSYSHFTARTTHFRCRNCNRYGHSEYLRCNIPVMENGKILVMENEKKINPTGH